MKISSILVIFVFPDNLEVGQVPDDVNWTNGIGKNDKTSSEYTIIVNQYQNL